MNRTHSPRAAALRRITAVVVGALLTLSAAACSTPTEPEPRRLTTSESELLSAARFRNYDAGTRRIDITIGEQDDATELTGYYDFVAHSGFVEVVSDGDPSTAEDDGFTNYVWWTTSVVGQAVVEAPSPDWKAGLPALDPAWGWEFFELDPSASVLISTLAMVTATGADRPDNPQLLAQSDALWLGSEKDGEWFQLPSTDELTPATGTPRATTTVPRFLVSDEGVIERMVVKLGDGTSATIDFGGSNRDAIPLPTPPAAGE